MSVPRKAKGSFLQGKSKPWSEHRQSRERWSWPPSRRRECNL